MKYFLRFTETPKQDLRRGTSLLTLPSLYEPVELKGLCGFYMCDDKDMDYGFMTDDKLKEKIESYRNNFHYDGYAVIYEGEFCEQNNPNGEGDIFKPSSIYKIY